MTGLLGLKTTILSKGHLHITNHCLQRTSYFSTMCILYMSFKPIYKGYHPMVFLSDPSTLI